MFHSFISQQNGTGVYPGEEWCNPYSPHAKWHVEAANGLMDLVYLADDLNRYTTNYMVTEQEMLELSKIPMTEAEIEQERVGRDRIIWIVDEFAKTHRHTGAMPDLSKLPPRPPLKN